jgi:transcriptional regulator with XRE-family HTH domain
MPLDYKKIRELRLALGKSMPQCAEEAGMNGRGDWYKVEAGKTTNLTIDKLERMASVLGVSAKDLLK